MTAEPLDSSLFPDSLFLPCGCALCRPPAASEGAMGDGTGPQSLQPQSLQPQFSVATVPSSAVLALLPSDVPRWGGGAVGSGATVTYSFMETAPSYAGSGDRLGFAVMSATQRAAVRLAVAAWSEVANINFVETSDSGNGGSIRFGTNRQRGVSAAYAYYPTGSPYDGGGDVYLANDSANNTNPTPGSYGFKTILHEIGHAIGLKHPGNYNAGGGGSEAPYLSSAEDNYRYTLMSYNDHPSLGLNGMVRSPALYDIAAVQHLYGANSLTRLGNDTYSHASPTTAFSASIWDAGGIDTIDAGGQTAAVTINLNGGSFSSIGTNGNRGAAVDNLSIAYGAVIENAIGGAGNDILLGNDADNALTGGAGGDSLTGGAGNDSLTGGPGTDTAVFSGNRADYTITADSGLAVITHNNGGSDGTDTLTGIEYALFADLRFNLQPPTVTGTNRTLTLGSAVAVSALLTATDPGGGSIVTYELIDGTANGGHLTVNGTEQASGGVVSVTAAALSTVTFVGAALGTDRITARVHNGTLWSGWTSLLVTTRPTNTAPTLQPDKALRFQESAPPTTLGVATPTDPDGDAMTVALTTLPGSGSIRRAGGATVTAGTTLTVADLAGLTYTPASGFAGEAGRFAYTVTDAQGNASRQTVTLTVDALSTLTTDFNPFVYLASNLDLADRFGLDGEAARAHYLQSGRFEGRATASFDAMAYLVQNTDVARAAGFDPTTAAAHYLTHGRFEGRGQSAFDALAYLAANPDLAVAFGTDTVQATRHYVTLGSAEGRRIAFDAYAYVAANPDLAAAFGVDRTAALRHYITLGRDEGRSTAFDALGYLAANPDLAASFGTDTTQATRHYILTGRGEGRSAAFDTLRYLAANPDLAAAFGTDIAGAERHYIALGRTEGRGTSFDVGGYLAANPQLRSAFNGDDTLALTYRILYDGRPRRDDAGFDPLTYLAANPDLAALYGTDTAAAQAHYDAHGRTEGRPTAFNGYAYLAGNPDLQAAFGGDETKALEHFIRLGRLELRPNPLGYTRPSNALAGAFAGSGTGASAFLGAAGAMPGFA